MSSITLNAFYAAEPVLMGLALFALLRSKERRRFPALFYYFSLRLTAFVALFLLLHARVLIPVSQESEYLWYFYSYWIGYLAGAVAVFFVIQELFKFSLEPLPGLKRLGSIAFRWVAGLSFLAALAALIVPGTRGNQLLAGAAAQLMRCESIFILSLLLFLVLAAKHLGISYRSRIFTVSFGFGIMAASNLISSALYAHSINRSVMTSTVSMLDTGAWMLTLLVWTASFLRQEPARMPITLAVSSPLVRWNEIALALSHGAGRNAATAPASDFFLQDVESVVDRVLIKNSLHIAS